MAEVFLVIQDVGVYESDRKIVAVCSTHDIAYSKACDLLASQFMKSSATAGEFRTYYYPIVIEVWDIDGDRSDGAELTIDRAAQLRPELQQEVDRREEGGRDEAGRDEAKPIVAERDLMQLVQYGAQPLMRVPNSRHTA